MSNISCREGWRRFASTRQTEPAICPAKTSAARAHIQLQPFPGSVPTKTTARGDSVPDSKNNRCTSLVTSSNSFSPIFSGAVGEVNGAVATLSGSSMPVTVSCEWKISCSFPNFCRSSKFRLISIKLSPAVNLSDTKLLSVYSDYKINQHQLLRLPTFK